MITLNTIMYDGNIDDIINPLSWFMTYTSTYITIRQIIINNLTNENNVLRLNEFKKINPTVNIVYVNDNLNVIDEYKLNISPKTIGYYYTIPYFVAIKCTKTDYILNVASDCMSDIMLTDEFIGLAINELKTNNSCLSTMISWVKDNHLINNVTVGEHENIETFKLLNKEYKTTPNFNYTFGFTDQFFLSDVNKLKLLNYNISESISNKIYNGPAYGGNAFEKRIVGNQIENNLYNCVYKKNDYYIHNGNYY